MTYAVVKTVIKDDPIGKIPLGKPSIGWEQFVRKRDLKLIDPRTNCEELVHDRERW